MTDIIFATGNAGKMREIKEILSDLPMKVLSMKEAHITIDAEENGSSFEENALIKARAGAKCAPNAIVMADDSGLEVDYLNKEPGIYSARYLGEDTSYEIKNEAILNRLLGVEKEKRTARFVCAAAAVFPNGQEIVVRETMEGFISEQAAGDGGFGYDPIFCAEPYGCTTAQLSAKQKNQISHRGKALRAMKEKLKCMQEQGVL